MDQEDKWTRFAATGRIQDYLDYSQERNISGTGETSSYQSSEMGTGDYFYQKKRDENGIVW